MHANPVVAVHEVQQSAALRSHRYHWNPLRIYYSCGDTGVDAHAISPVEAEAKVNGALFDA